MDRRWAPLAAVAVLAMGPAAAAPLEAYGKLPFVEQMTLSPDGKILAMAVTDGEKRKILFEQVDPLQTIDVLEAGDQKVRSLQWAGSNHLIITVSITSTIPDVIAPRDEYFMGLDYNLAKRAQKPIVLGVDDSLNIIYGTPDIRFLNGGPVAFVQGEHFVDNQGRVSLFKVGLDRGDATLANEGLPNTDNYVVGAKGELLAESEYDARTDRTRLRVWQGVWRDVRAKGSPDGTPTLRGLGRDGASILVSLDDDHKKTFRELSPDGTTWSDPLPLSPHSEPIFDNATYRLIGAKALEDDDESWRFFDPALQKAWEAAKAAYPGDRAQLVSMSDDHRKLVLRVDSATEGPAYALVDLDAKRGTWIANEYGGLKAGDIGPVRPIAFKAKDGLALTGYLTLPSGKDPKRLPLVVFPHGGPAERDEPGFDWWAQAMASRGYAVLQVNYRGSAGLGAELLSAGAGQFGRKMQTDLSDGVRYLAAQGIIDPARVCIVGASYGGYAALAGATLDPGVYRCAAAVAGVSSPRKMIAWDASREGQGGAEVHRYWQSYMGPEAALDEIAPLSHIDKVTIPILLVHGKDDTVVSYQQSQMMADALSRAGKPCTFVTLKAEDHWLSRGATRLEMLQAVMAFLQANNPAS